MLTYTLCIIENNGKLAMLFRTKSPNKHKWNFVGGKIEDGEDITAAAKREAEEETGLKLHSIAFRGIVKWNNQDGMYVYYSNDFTGELQSSNEGIVEWKSIDWINESKDVVSNIPYFLPSILNLKEQPKTHHFFYDQHGKIMEREVTVLEEEEIFS